MNRLHGAVLATALLAGAGGACAAGPEAGPPITPTTTETTIPVETTTTLDPGTVESCLTQGIEERGPDKQYLDVVTTGTPQCVEYVHKMYTALSSTAMYKPYITTTEPYFGRTINQAGRFQASSGINLTYVFDTTTVQTMRHELDRMKQAPVGCKADDDPNAWSRETLVDRLAEMGAFTVTAAFVSAPRTDLLDPNLSTEALVKETSQLTQWATCNNIRFNVLDIHTGHADATLSGNRSLHVMGRAIDIRPFNDDKPMPAWSAQDSDPQLPEQAIINNPQALSSANKVLDFLATQASGIQEEIWTDAKTSITNGRVVPNFSHGQAVDANHHDHIHIGVK